MFHPYLEVLGTLAFVMLVNWVLLYRTDVRKKER